MQDCEPSKVSPAKKELHEKMAQLNSRYVARGGERQEKGMGGLEELGLFSEETTPTNDMGFLRYDPNTNRLTLEQDNHQLGSTPQ